MRHEDAQPNDANEARRQWLKQTLSRQFGLTEVYLLMLESKALSFELHVFERESKRTWLRMLVVQLSGVA